MFIALDSKSDISEINSMTMNSANFLTKNENRSRSFLLNNVSVDIGTPMNILDRINVILFFFYKEIYNLRIIKMFKKFSLMKIQSKNY